MSGNGTSSDDDAPSRLNAAIARGLAFLERFQSRRGSLHATYDGALFLAPGFVIARHVIGSPFEEAVGERLLQTIGRAQNDDGGFGLDVQGESCLFSTALNYVALRLLGMDVDSERTRRARAWILAHGGALRLPSSGQYWLAILGVYEWEGVHPVPPELLLLPQWVPLHPSRMWCHTRVVYLSIAYLYGRRWRAPASPLLSALRAELYVEDYAHIDFARHRDDIAETDLQRMPTLALRILRRVSSLMERVTPAVLRRHALAVAWKHILHGLESSSFIDLGPVNKALNVVVCHAQAPGSAHVQRALDRVADYLFEGEDGLTVQAYNSSEIWDTELALHAMHAAGMPLAVQPMARRACEFLVHEQFTEDVPDRVACWRESRVGGWSFSTREQGWPVIDCTALALTALLQCAPTCLPASPLLAAVDLLLYWQNRDGGWPAYERRRAGRWMEALNPSEIFNRIMVDASRAVLTSAAVQALALVRDKVPVLLDARRLARIEQALRRGAESLRAAQHADGSWHGTWGVCFTYGTWFGVEGLRACGVPASDATIVRAGDFLMARQRHDGGWGESLRGCVAGHYIDHVGGSQASMTAWALLTLLEIPGARTRAAARRGAECLMRDQRADGDWPYQGLAGVFNDACGLDYRLYRIYFPVWALARWKTREADGL